MIQAGRVEDEQVASELIALSMGAFGDALFGLGDPALHRKLVAAMYCGLDTRFSHRLVELAEVEGQLVGLLLSLPGRDMARLEVPMVGYFTRLYGFTRLLRFLWRTMRMIGFEEATRSEYYVSNLAVLPDWTGRGIGRLLLERAEQKARQAGLDACSLSVEINNPRARSLYEWVGYQVVHTTLTPQLEKSMGTVGHLRMVKQLGPAQGTCWRIPDSH